LVNPIQPTQTQQTVYKRQANSNSHASEPITNNLLQSRLSPLERLQSNSDSTETVLTSNLSPLDNLLANTSPAISAPATQATGEVSELGFGSNGPAVETLQQQLTERGYDLGTVDGDFGPKTAAALRDFQQDRINSLQSALDGGAPPLARSQLQSQVIKLTVEKNEQVAGAETQRQLNIATPGLQSDTPIAKGPVATAQAATQNPPAGLGLGDQGAEVRSLQLNLERAGYSPGSVDSSFGGNTLTALKDFQQDQITKLDSQISVPGLPIYAADSIRETRDTVQAELDAEVAGAATLRELDRVVISTIPGDLPINRDLQVNNDGFITDDTNIIANRVPQLEQGAFNDPVGDINNVVLHRTVTDTADQALTSFATPRNGTHFGTHFLIGRDGTIQQTASLNNITYHVANLNSETIGIEVVGNPLDANGDVTVGPPHGNPVASWEPLTPDQIESVAYLTNTLNDHYGLGSETTEAHEDLQAKTEGEGGTVFDAIQHLLIP